MRACNVAVLIGAGLLLGCGGGSGRAAATPAASPSPTPSQTPTATVEASKAPASVRASGRLRDFLLEETGTAGQCVPADHVPEPAIAAAFCDFYPDDKPEGTFVSFKTRKAARAYFERLAGQGSPVRDQRCVDGTWTSNGRAQGKFVMRRSGKVRKLIWGFDRHRVVAEIHSRSWSARRLCAFWEDLG